jgi:DNA-binding NarL/FixJ family response regulator
MALKRVTPNNDASQAGSQGGRGRFKRPTLESVTPPDADPRGPRIALVGGSKLHQEALTWVLNAEGAEVVGSFETAGVLLETIENSSPDVVMIDADDANAGVGAIVELREAAPQIKIIVLAEDPTPQVISTAVEQRVEGFLLKEHSADELVSALQHVLRGRSVFPGGWQELAAQVSTPSPLTEREYEVLELLAQGLRNEEIAAKLVISLNTVKFHVRTIYSRLGVRNRVEASQILARMHEHGDIPASARDKHAE